MFLFYLYLIILLFGLFFRNNKLFYVIQIVFIFILMAGNTDNADYTIYYNRYEHVDWFMTNTEWLFNNIIVFSKNIGMSYEMWRKVVSLFYCIVIGIIVYKMSKDSCNTTMSLLMIYSVFIDNVQLRQTLAMLFGFIAIYFLFKYKNSNKNFFIILSIVFILLGGGIHASTYLYLLLLIPFIIDKKNYFYAICGIIFVFFLLLIFNIGFLSKIGEFLISEDKMNIIFSEDSVNLTFERTKRFLLIGFISIIYILPYIYFKYFNNKIFNRNMDLLFKMNIIMLCAICPLIFVDLEFYRVFQILILFNIIGCTKMYDSCNRFETTKKNICISTISSVCLLLCLYFLVLSNTNIESVFWSIFQNNSIF